MTEPQVWTMMGGFFAIMVGTLTLIATGFMRVVQAEIGGLRGEMNARFDTVDAKFDKLDHRIDGLDRDVQLLMRREFGT